MIGKRRGAAEPSDTACGCSERCPRAWEAECASTRRNSGGAILNRPSTSEELEYLGSGQLLRAGDQQKPKYIKLNPNAVVPMLVDGGNVIIESTVINEYLDGRRVPGRNQLRVELRLVTGGRSVGCSSPTGRSFCSLPRRCAAIH